MLLVILVSSIFVSHGSGDDPPDLEKIDEYYNTYCKERKLGVPFSTIEKTHDIWKPEDFRDTYPKKYGELATAPAAAQDHEAKMAMLIDALHKRVARYECEADTHDGEVSTDRTEDIIKFVSGEIDEFPKAK